MRGSPASRCRRRHELRKSFIPQITAEEARLAAEHFGWEKKPAAKIQASAAAISEATAGLGFAIPREGISLERLDELLHRQAQALPPTKRIAIKNKLAAAGMLIENGFDDAQNRTYVTACMMQVKAGLEPGRPYSVKELDAHLAKSSISLSHKMEIKSALHAAGLLKGDVIDVPAPRPDANVVRNICARIEIDPPAPGTKLSLAAVNKAIRERGFGSTHSIDIKEHLYAAGVL